MHVDVVMRSMDGCGDEKIVLVWDGFGGMCGGEMGLEKSSFGNAHKIKYYSLLYGKVWYWLCGLLD